MLNNIYNFIYLLGLETIRCLKKFGKRMKSVILRPLRAITTLAFTALIVIDKFTLKTFHEITADVKSLFGNTRRVISEARSNETETGKERLKKLPLYFSKMWKLYKHVFVYAGNIILPVISFIIMLNVIFAWSGTTFALELTYNGKVIGYVKSEAVYKTARKQAVDRLQISTAEQADTDEEGEFIGNAEYSLKTVKLSKISDAEAICDSLIENSNCEITNACGVYIDDKFLCAVKNETDALAIFDNIISEYETDDDSAVSFVEDINYVQGLYPDNENTVWDAKRLSEKLADKKSEARYYTVKAGDTVSRIAEECEVSTADIFALNPELSESIHVGQRILIEKDVNFVQVQITKTETHTEKIKHSTVKVNTDSLYVGDSKTVVKGSDGEQTVTELVTYIDGVRVSSKEVSRVTTKEAVDEKIQVGTKRNNFYGSGGGNYNFSYSGAKFCWPGVGATIISSRYGKRALNGWHNGIDLCRPGGSKGAPVVAAESGRVVYAGYEGMGGYVIRIDHGNGIVTMYAHLKTGSICVRTGQYVTRGQQIAQIGDTGYVTGAHLHFEVRVNGNRVNPAPYLGIR